MKVVPIRVTDGRFLLIIKVIGGYYEREERPRCSNGKQEDNRIYEDIRDWERGFYLVAMARVYSGIATKL